MEKESKTSENAASKAHSIELRVAEAAQKDVGRGLVRLDPADMDAIGLKTGDTVEIKGTRATVARVVPAHAEQRGQKLVAMDGIVRANSEAGLGELVAVRPMAVEPARRVKLLPTGERGGGGDVSGRYLARLLQGIPVAPGDRVRLSSFGTQIRNFTVAETEPKGPVLIQPETTIRCEGGSKASSIVTYEDVGGLKRELASIREMIELPLKYPEIFAQLGIDAPKGVLMHGPPGCGKTLIARAVAHETDARFFVLSGPEIMHKYYGESEAHLRKVFEEAAKAPSIIFLDEIDAIAPKRAALGGEQQVERRVVSQLLTLMDGLDGRGQVVVIGATNLPDSLDPALRRPGRFDREIVIGVPDRPGRREILEVYTRGMPLGEDVDLERLAQATHGFVGADLQSLAREAAMARLRRIFPDIDFDMDYIPERTLAGITVGMEDFQRALAVVEPSAIREVFTEIPNVRWEDVGGLGEIKQLLEETIQWPLSYPDLFRKADITPPRGILLNGPPGVGKTLVAKALATESGVNFISIKGPALMNKWVGESERAVRDVFHKAKLASPCILFLDEIDSIAPRRGGGDATAVSDRIIAQLLTEMDGVEELRGVLVLAATNRRELVDPALLRAGRFDFVIDLPFPDRESRREIYRVHTRAKPLDKNVNVDELASGSEGCSGADIELHCRKASAMAIREFLVGGLDPVTDLDKLVISRHHFDQVFKAEGKRDKTPVREASNSGKRVLVHIPIVHSQADMGSYGSEIRRTYIAERGAKAWTDSRQAIDAFWQGLEQAILSREFDYSRVRIYQDALPVCGREADIIRDLAKTGGANYRIVLELMRRGATLEGTESLELLLHEYDLLKSNKDDTEPPVARQNHELAAELLQARDRFIAERIDRTLKPGEFGLMFIGALHRVTELLPETIEVATPEDWSTGLI